MSFVPARQMSFGPTTAGYLSSVPPIYEERL